MRQCGSVKQCGSARQCEQQGAAVRAAVCGSVHGSGRAVRAVVCGSVFGSVWQCARQCVAVHFTYNIHKVAHNLFIGTPLYKGR